MQRLKEDAAQAKVEKRTFGARLDSATATVRKAREQVDKANDAFANAQRWREEAKLALEEAEDQLSRLKEQAAAEAEPAVVSEARALLEALESAPLASTASNRAVPEKLLAQMRKLRETLLEHGDDEDDGLEDAELPDLSEHLDTGDEGDKELPGRCILRRSTEGRASSAGPSKRRTGSNSRTPPPDSAQRRKLGG